MELTLFTVVASVFWGTLAHIHVEVDSIQKTGSTIATRPRGTFVDV